MDLGEMGRQNGNQTCLTGDNVDELLQARLIDRRVHIKDEFLDHLLNNQIFKEEPQVQISLSPIARKHLVGYGLLIFQVSRLHSDTPHSVGLLQTIDQCVAQTLTTHITRKSQTSTPPAGFEPAAQANERPKTQALDRAATEIGPLQNQPVTYDAEYVG